jgi:hypothetical protein
VARLQIYLKEQRKIVAMKRVLKSVLAKFGYAMYRITPRGSGHSGADFLNTASADNPDLTVILVGTSEAGYEGMGKVSPHLYFPKFVYGLAKRGAALIGYRDCAEALRNISRHDPKRTIVVLIYNESFQREAMKEFESLASQGDFIIYNAPRTGEIIGDKIANNKFLQDSGILTPSIVNGKVNQRTFSNARVGSNAAVNVVDAGQPLDPERYNSSFINTVHTFKGKSYYVALRTLTVTDTILSAYVRLRPVEENSPSVHAMNTPRDPELISHFHHALVTLRQNELDGLCEKMGLALGPGFYVHDILPCADDGRLYVSETGYKFDDMAYRDWLWPISADLPFLDDHFTINIADMAANEVVKKHR